MARARIEKILGGLESARRRLTAEIESVHDPAFHARPSPRDWSVAQVIEHLALVDEAVARGIGAVTAGKLKVERRRGDSLRKLLWTFGIYKMVRIRVPGAGELPAKATRAEALSRIRDTREKLLAAIDAGERVGMWSHSLRHPIFGPLPMREMLDFVAHHEERHRLQIVRIKAALTKQGVLHEETFELAAR